MTICPLPIQHGCSKAKKRVKNIQGVLLLSDEIQMSDEEKPMPALHVTSRKG